MEFSAPVWNTNIGERPPYGIRRTLLLIEFWQNIRTSKIKKTLTWPLFCGKKMMPEKIRLNSNASCFSCWNATKCTLLIVPTIVGNCDMRRRFTSTQAIILAGTLLGHTQTIAIAKSHNHFLTVSQNLKYKGMFKCEVRWPLIDFLYKLICFIIYWLANTMNISKSRNTCSLLI